MRKKSPVPYAITPAAPVATHGREQYAGRTSAVFFGMIVREGPGSHAIDSDAAALQTYFNDTYFLFLHNLTRFALRAVTTDGERRRLRFLFEQLIRTREMLEEER